MSSKLVREGGFGMSITFNRLKCWNYFNTLISRTILFASIKSSKALGTFLMATLVFVKLSYALITTPYDPIPTHFMNSYLLSTINTVSLTLKILF